MEFTHSTSGPAEVEADVLVVPLYEDDATSRAPLRDLDRALDGRIGQAIERGELKGKLHRTTPWPASGIGSRLILFVGAGKRSEADADRMRQVYGTAARNVRDSFESASLVLRSDSHAQPAVEGFAAGAYEPDLLKGERSQTRTTSVTVIAKRADKALRDAVAAGDVVGRAINLARELVAMPPNDLTPTVLAERARDELKPLGVDVEILKGKKLEPFGGLLGVAKGSDEPPVLVSMTWEPARARKQPVLGLVGKGVTFDSGGLSLKPPEGMTWMKGDMAGAAAVIAAMRAIAELRVPVRVRAIVPATENMPSGKATRVGDVLRLYSGKTAEILNTDAEGRLILADALAWAGEKEITHMVDAATLTGAVVIALGNTTIGVMGRPDGWVNRVVGSARKAGEKAWPLPLYPEYREQLHSEIADLKNVGGRAAGTITAGWFLAENVPEDIEWAHLDIAGTAWSDDKKPYRSKGATGSAVPTFVRLAQDLAAKK